MNKIFVFGLLVVITGQISGCLTTRAEQSNARSEKSRLLDLKKESELLSCANKYLNGEVSFAPSSNSKPKILPQQGTTRSSSLRLAANGELLVVDVGIGVAKNIKIFDYRSGLELQTFAPKDGGIKGFFVSKDGSKIAISKSPTDSASYSKPNPYRIDIYNIATKHKLATCKGSKPVDGFSSPDGRWAIYSKIHSIEGDDYTTSYKTEIGVRDLSGVMSSRRLGLVKGIVLVDNIVISPDSKVLAAVGKDNKAKLWNIASGEKLSEIQFKEKATSGLAVDNKAIFYQRTPSGKVIALSSKNKTGRIISNVNNVQYAGMSISPDNQSLLFYQGSSLRVANISDGRVLRSFINANALAVVKNGQKILLRTDGANIPLDKNSLKPISLKNKIKLKSKDSVRTELLPLGLKYQLHGVMENPETGITRNSTYSTRTGEKLAEIKGKYSVTSISPDFTKILVQEWDGLVGKVSTQTMKVLSLPDLKVISKSKLPEGILFAGEFSADGDSLLFPGKKGIHTVDVKTGRIKGFTHYPVFKTSGEYKRKDQTISAVALSSDGKYVAVYGHAIEGVQVYDIRTQAVKVYNSHSDTVSISNRFKFSESGEYLFYTFASKAYSIQLSTGKVTEYVGHIAMILDIVEVDKARVMTSSYDSSVKVWNIKTGELLASFFSFGEKDWVWVTPDGIFDASKKGADYLNVHVNGKVLSIDQFHDKLYRPDILYASISGHSYSKPQKTVLALSSKGAPPEVHLAEASVKQTGKRERLFKAAITDQGGGIGKLEWRINGVLVGLDSDSRALKLKQAAGPKGKAQVERILTLSPGMNEIELVAYNKSGDIASTPETVRIKLKDAVSEKPGLYVLVTGINKYRDKDLWLNYAVPDSNSLAKSFKRIGKNIFTKVEVVKLLDANVTKANLEKTFASLGKKVKSNDVFVFYLAGHGITQDGKYHFLPVDFRYRNEDSVRKSAVNQGDLQQMLSQISAQKSLVLLDTCNSGSYVQAQTVTRGLSEKTAISKLTRATGRATIAASSDTQVAYEGYKGHGVFTWAILNALKTADKTHGNKDGVTTTDEVASYIDETVPNVTYKKWGYEQVPQVNLHGRPFPVGIAN